MAATAVNRLAGSGATPTPSHLEAGTAGTPSRGGSYSLCGRIAHYGTDTILGVNIVGSFIGGVWSFVEGTYPQAGLFTFSVLVSVPMLYVAEKFFAMKALKEEADQIVKEEHQLQGDEQELARIRGQFETISGQLQQSEATLGQRGKELALTKDELASTADKLGKANLELGTLKDAQERDLSQLKASIGEMSLAQKELQRQLAEKDVELKKESETARAIKQDNDRLGALLVTMQQQVARMQTSFEGFKESVSSYASLNASFQAQLPEFGEIIKQFQGQGQTIGKETDTLGHSVEDFDVKFKADIQALDQQMSQARQITEGIFAKLRDEILELRRETAKFKEDIAQLGALQTQIGDKETQLDRLQASTQADLAKLDEIKQSLLASETKLAGLQEQIAAQELILQTAMKKAAAQGDNMASTEQRLHHDMDRAGDLLKQFQQVTEATSSS